MKDRRSKKIKNLRKGGVRGFLFGNPIIPPPVPEFHYKSPQGQSIIEFGKNCITKQVVEFDEKLIFYSVSIQEQK